MKKNLFTLLAVLALAASAYSAGPTYSVTVNWAANPPADQVTKYTLYVSSGIDQPFMKVGDVIDGTTSYTINGLIPGLYVFQVTASNGWDESAPSVVVVTPSGVPTAPLNPKIQSIIRIIK